MTKDPYRLKEPRPSMRFVVLVNNLTQFSSDTMVGILRRKERSSG